MRAPRRDRPGLELIQAGRVHRDRGVVAAQRRDLPGGADRRRDGGHRQAGGGADESRARDAGRVRPLLRGGWLDGRRRGGRRGHQRDPRRRERVGVPRPGAQAHEAADPRPQPRGGGPLWISGGGQLDDAERWLHAGPRRRLDAAGGGERPTGARVGLVAGGGGEDDRALPAQRRPGEATSDRGAARARGAGAPQRGVAGADGQAPGGDRRDGAQPRRRGAARGRAAEQRRARHDRDARGAGGDHRAAGGADALAARERAGGQAGASGPDPGGGGGGGGRVASGWLRRLGGDRGGTARGGVLRAPPIGSHPPRRAPAVRRCAPGVGGEPRGALSRGPRPHPTRGGAGARYVRPAGAYGAARGRRSASGNCCGRRACCTTSGCLWTTTTTTSTRAI